MAPGRNANTAVNKALANVLLHNGQPNRSTHPCGALQESAAVCPSPQRRPKTSNGGLRVEHALTKAMLFSKHNAACAFPDVMWGASLIGCNCCNMLTPLHEPSRVLSAREPKVSEAPRRGAGSTCRARRGHYESPGGRYVVDMVAPLYGGNVCLGLFVRNRRCERFPGDRRRN